MSIFHNLLLCKTKIFIFAFEIYNCTLLAWVWVFVCLNSKDFKTDIPIELNFFEATHMYPGKVFVMRKLNNFDRKQCRNLVF